MPQVTYLFELDLGEAPPEVDVCEELGRVTRAFVSGYQRARVHLSRLVRGEKRCLTANFNGAIPVSRTITSVTWRTNQGFGVFMSNARIVTGGREVAVDIAAQGPGQAAVKCEVTLDNGEVYNQLFRVCVQYSPWFVGEVPTSAGPTSLTVTA